MAEVREHSGKNETDIKFMAIVKDSGGQLCLWP